VLPTPVNRPARGFARPQELTLNQLLTLRHRR
jgi:hypothetical protein